MMIRTLLTTTAFALVLTGGALAQDAAPATPADPGLQAPAVQVLPDSLLAKGYQVADTDNLATNIIGRQVYASAAQDAEHIGDINNIVIGQDGRIAAVVVGVGGFLGIGEKNVAVNYAELQWQKMPDNSDRFVLATTKEALQGAPDFKAIDGDQQTAADAAANTLPADNSMAPANTNVAANAPADANAAPMAPADNTIVASKTAPADTSAVANVDRSKLQAIDVAALTGDQLKGTDVWGDDGQKIGTISDFVLNTDGKTIDAVVIDVGGFLGIGAKPVAVALDNIQFTAAPDDANKRVMWLAATKDQLNAQPAFDKNTYANERDTQRLVVQAS